MVEGYCVSAIRGAMKHRIISAIKQRISNQSNPRISIYGLGVTNRAVLDILLEGFPSYEITLRLDKYDADINLPDRIRIIYGDDARNCIDEDIVFCSPSVRREKISVGSNTLLTSDMDIFLADAPRNCLAVSGSDGKSTVTTMCYLMLNSAFSNVFQGGNIGVPIANAAVNDTDAFVLELSSFMLRYTYPTVRRGVITNITPNHLNWHKDMSEYTDTKLRLIRYTEEAVINADDTIISAQSKEAYAVVSCEHSHRQLLSRFKANHTVTLENGCVLIDGRELINASELNKKEPYNIQNFMLAAAMSLNIAKNEDIAEVGRTFQGLAHRCEVFLIRDGITFINSSIDTTPERTVSTLSGLDKNVVIILGGTGKNISPQSLEIPLSKYAKRIALYGSYGCQINELIERSELCSSIPHASFEDFDDAVEYATRSLESKDTLLLSPAATGYGQFTSYAHRGNHFKEYIVEKYKKI